MLKIDPLKQATPLRETAALQTSPWGWAIGSLSLSILLSSMGTSIANVGLPALAQAFGAPFQAVQWVVIAYLLAITTLIVSVGRLGDLVGRKRLLLAGIALFTLASVVCGISPWLWLLIAARALQGLGAAVMMALTMAFVGQTVPKAKTGSAMGLLATMSAIGTALGPSLGGALVSEFGWPALFLINVPMGILTFVLAWRHLPMDRRALAHLPPGFDHLGAFLLALTLAAYALAMTTGRSHWEALNYALLGAATLGVGAFVWVQATAGSPLIHLALFRNRALCASLAMNALVSTVMMATLVVGPFYLARGLGLATSMVGAVMSVGPLISVFGGVVSGRMVDRWGTSRITLAGLVAMTLGALALCNIPAALGIAGYVTGIAILTPGYQLFQSANNTAVMVDVQADQRGLISGLLTLSRNLGLVTGASVMGAVFAFAAQTADISTAAPQSIARGMHFTFAMAAVLTSMALALAMAAYRTARIGR
ncbi:MFS transporter [Rhodoferax sp. GW822-FHT02A01]|uniref:MFS transporter n=1 Tax=Rhodoferax sp. GW822-FHT02A01 TaxID=3141537 RepID=UPI00315D5BDE